MRYTSIFKNTSQPLSHIRLLACLILFISSGDSWGLSATATASSQASGGMGPSNVLDESTATFWSSAVSPTQYRTEWIRFELDQLAAIRGITLTPRQNGYGFPKTFQLEYSYDENGTYWFPVPGASREDFATPTGPVNLIITGRVFARRLRITANRLGQDDYGNYYFQLAGVSFIEHPAKIPFQLERGGDFSNQINNLWNIFGSLGDGTNAVYSFGNEPAYFEWMALKYLWNDNTTGYATTLRSRMVEHPICQNGYVWSWGDQMRWPTGYGLGVWSRHEENNAKYILGCWRYWCWTRNDAFFNMTDSTKVTGSPDPTSCTDVSQGKTIQQKLRLAMQYIDDELGGSNGGILVENSGDTDGTTSGDPTNYWDNWRFGYKNAYNNIYYYAALEAMAQMEETWGNPTRAEELHFRRSSVRQDYNKEFWDAVKGRYIGTKDITGKAWDFGFTFLNTEAVYYGLADQDQARSIFEWLSGSRIIAGENSTGADIYGLKWAPRSNTIAAERSGPPYWWEDIVGNIRVDTKAARYGNHLENGGAIFYTSFYDVLARARTMGIENADGRLGEILAEFRKDQLRRDPANSAGAAWMWGIIGEFPESGLVGTLPVYLYGGIEPDINGLHINPHLPEVMDTLTIRGITYAGSTLDLTITRSTVSVASQSNSTRTLYHHREEIIPGETRVFEYQEGSDLILTLEAEQASSITGWEYLK